MVEGSSELSQFVPGVAEPDPVREIFLAELLCGSPKFGDGLENRTTHYEPHYDQNA